MLQDEECRSGGDCGCQITHFLTTRNCPTCGRRLRLTGRSQLLEFRLTCPDCGYQSPLLSQEELQVLL